ncbi:alpha/beta hydrolase fold protein [Arthroderma uncinatum]|uniref:alpha/beta hydrolase fold protein n=1 Tax=Arthroderma uncinatum TaxID=74035 RepID=UPI00144A797E|nr:alpha/beta hydrolase fold protein [Arthroderma uncinatum]KAF3482536.1 alpha/beta hydrolase fold protein [Arthroderma uncinatum]
MAEKALVPVNAPTKLTLREKLDFIPAGLGFVATAIAAAITGLVRGQDGIKSYRTHVRYAVVRRFLWRMSIRQLHFIYPSTAEAYQILAKKKRFTPETVQLEHGAQGHWIGKKDAKNVLIYYHGGGFALSAYVGHFQFYYDMMTELNAAGKDISIFFISYTLSPEGVYPTQLRQAVGALRYIVEETGRDPQTIFMGGDSAGGHLTFGVLSHLSHPHEAIKPLDISGPLGGAFTMAPWVSLAAELPSYTRNAHKDYLSMKCGSAWAAVCFAGSEPDNYNQASQAPPEWWKDIKTKALLIVIGKNDVIVDGYVVSDGEAHIGPIMDRIMGDKTDTGMSKAMRAWFMEQL